MTTYRDSRGATVQTGSRLGGGGEAEVFAIQGRSDLVAKIYHKPTSEHDQKLGLMIASPPVDPCHGMRPPHISIAWPRERLYHTGGDFAGYIMPAVKGAVLLLQAFNPAERARTFRSYPWNYLHQTAINLARAVNAIHARNYVIGDINESNVLLFPNTLITLIDTDSFQVQHYPCPVGKPEYTPPELQGKNLRSVQRTVQHDYFGLAVLIFQLLMEGNHPFRARWIGGGTPITTEQEKIALGLFPYSRSPSSKVQPPPSMHSFDMLHPAVADLMRRCFEDGHRDPQCRPNPAEWEQALQTANSALVKCRRNPAHYYANHQCDCPWCAAIAQRASAATTRITGPQVPLRPVPLVGQTTVTPAQPSRSTPVQTTQAAVPTSPLARSRVVLSRLDWKLIALWVNATGVSGILGWIALAMFGQILSDFLLFQILSLNSSAHLYATVDSTIMALFFGTVMGIGQWLVLRQRPIVRDARWWVPATALGWALGNGIGFYSGVWLQTGVVVAAIQWLVLRRSVQRAGWWIAASVFIGIAIWADSLLALAGLVLYLLLSGITLSLLLGQRKTAQPHVRIHQPTAPMRWVWLAIILSLIAVLWIFQSYQKQPIQDIQGIFMILSPKPSELSRCHESVDSGNWDQAIIDCSHAIQKLPKNIDTYNARGVAYFEIEQYQLAIDDFNQAIAVSFDFNFVLAYLNRSYIALAHFNRGHTYAHLKDYNTAIRDYNEAERIGIAGRSREYLYYNRATIYYYRGEYDTAIYDYSKAIDTNPYKEQYYYDRGSAYSHKKNYEQAIIDYSKVIEIAPSRIIAYYDRALMYMNTNNTEAAVNDLRFCLTHTEDLTLQQDAKNRLHELGM